MRRPAFTLIELLVVIAVIAVLIAVLLPSLGAAKFAGRVTVCGGRLQQIGIATTAYLNDFDNTLPQRFGPLPGGGEAIIAALFGGKKGQLPFYGVNRIGAEGRPLNRYLIDTSVPQDKGPDVFPVESFRSPIDKGATNTGVPIPGFDRTDSMYDFIGASYTMNDHAPTGEGDATLIPTGGGRMPVLTHPSRTWVVGTHTIYNYDQGGDRGMNWFGRAKTEANLLFMDMHVRMRLYVPPGMISETEDYSFLP